jgi:hypothetical protein
MEADTPRQRGRDPGYLACGVVGLLLLGFALGVDFRRAAFGFQSDGATYYSLAYSLAHDLDFAFERKDLERVWHEFPTGPEGIFLKKGKDVRLGPSGRFPFLWSTTPDTRDDRLYYAKSYIYPVAVAPFVRAFGTNGFLVFHGLLLTLCLTAAYSWLRATSPPGIAFGYAFAFLFASAAPVYMVWLTPELFNLAVVFLGTFLWTYKLAAPGDEAGGRLARFLRSPASDVAAAVLIGIAAFSKPTNVLAAAPLVIYLAWQRRWRHGARAGLVCAGVVAGLFLLNVAITGEYNYQGGDRNTFYGATGFPFQRPGATFDNTGMSRATNAVPTDVLVNRDALLRVFPRNLVYFVFGRHTGQLPYFFPGVVSGVLLLLAWRRATVDRWLLLGGAVAAAVVLLLYMPFTYSGGGGPVGNRYYMPFYALLLFATPPLRSAWPVVSAAGIGGLFTAQLVFNPFWVSFHPAEHPKSGPFRLLPVELSLLNDLPVNVTPSRIKQPLGGEPPLLAYFLDDNAYPREGEWFWVRGESRAEMILRSPARQTEGGTWESLRLQAVVIEFRAGDTGTQVVAASGWRRSTLDLPAGGTGSVRLPVSPGLPYRAIPGQPTNYIYLLSIASSQGFVPLFTSGARDSRFLGVMTRVVPVYQ